MSGDEFSTLKQSLKILVYNFLYHYEGFQQLALMFRIALSYHANKHNINFLIPHRSNGLIQANA